MSLKSLLVNTLRKFPLLKRRVKNLYQFVGNLLSDRKSWPNSIQQVSSSESEHLFGYYDKTPWDSQGKTMIYLRVKGASSHAASTEPVSIILRDAGGQERIIATTHSWNVQQGCMLQWYAGQDDQILFNDFLDGDYCSVIKNIVSGEETRLCVPTYTLSSDGKTALTLDFSRLHTLRPGYGYINKPDNTSELLCPEGYAISRLNISSNTLYPLYTYRQLAELQPLSTMEGAYHKVNHIMLSPSGKGFIFLHRWIQNGRKYDRLLWAPTDGSALPTILLDEGMVSHSNWRDEDTIITYANALGRGPGYCLVDVPTGTVTDLSNFFPAVDGHPSFSPDSRYVITDTYPDFRRKQALFLIDMQTAKSRQVASLYAPGRYRNDSRCDLHPRWSRDSRQICFDGCMSGKRQVYILDIAEGE